MAYLMATVESLVKKGLKKAMKGKKSIAVGQSALPTLWGLRRSSTERRNDRFLIIGKL
jgi:hypothetical protein